jgi:hypothetical protein
MRSTAPAFRFAVLFAVATLLLAGCTGAGAVQQNYDAARDETTYTTGRMPTGLSLNPESLTGGTPVNMRVEARCEGRECLPDHAFLTLYKGGGPATVTIPNRRFRIKADRASYEWSSRRHQRGSVRGTGAILRVRIGFDRLTQIAEAKSVEGWLGNNNFTMSYKQRAPIRRFVAKMQDDEGGSQAQS